MARKNPAAQERSGFARIAVPAFSTARLEIRDFDFGARCGFDFIGKDCVFMDGSRLSERLRGANRRDRRFDDLIELEIVRQQRRGSKRLVCTIAINRRIRSFPPGQRVVTIL
jgi:hypothetical protein